MRVGYFIRFISVLCLLAAVSACESEAPPAADPPAAQVEPKIQETVELPAEESEIRWLNIAERERDGRNQLAVQFSHSVDASKPWQRYVQVMRKDGVSPDGEWVLDETGRTAWFRATDPQAAYVISIQPGLPATNGSVLATGTEKNLTTRRLTPIVTFDDQGSLLPAGYGRGLPVTTVNIAAVDVDFHRVRDQRLAEFLASAAGNPDYLQWQADSLAAMADLAYTGRFDLEPELNARTKRSLPFDGVAELQEPGVYFVVMRPAGRYNEQRQVTHFSVTDLGVQARRYANQLDVRVNSLATGEPLSDVTVSLVDSEGASLASIKTTPEGLASFSSPVNEARLVVARADTHITALPLARPALDLSAFDLGARPQRETELFIYGPRDLYRPGETLRLSALLRDGDGKLAAAVPLQARLRRPDGVTAREFVWQPGALAHYDTEYGLPAGAPTGRWELQVSLPGGARVTHGIQVEEFLPERIRVELGQARSPVSVEETIIQPVTAEYLYGAPASGNRVEALVRVGVDRSPIADLEEFLFGRVDAEVDGTQFEITPVNLDDSGEISLRIPSRWAATDSPLTVNAIVSVFESGGRAVTRAQSQTVWPAGVLPGIRPMFGKSNPPANQAVSFQMVLSDPLGDRNAGRIEASLIREDRQYFWEFDDSRGWHWSYSEENYEVASTLVDVNADAAVRVSLPVEWGRYRFEATDVATGRKASIRFHAGEDWYARWQDSANAGSRPDAVALTLDRDTYLPGSTAQLRIQPPHDGQALIVVESDRTLWSRTVNVEETGTVIDIPVARDWRRHDIYISATVLRPMGQQRAITPKRAVGVVHLPLDRRNRNVAMVVSAPAKIEPSQPLSVSIESPLDGEAYVTLAAVDMGVLNITDFETPSAADYFFGQRRYAVEVRDVYAQVIEVFEAQTANLTFGGGAAAAGGRRPPSDVRIVSLYQGPVALDNGVATVELELPDFEGRLRLMALGYSADSFAMGQAEVTVASKVVAQLSKPRFLAMGDQSQVALDLTNLSGESQQLDVEWNVGDGLRMDAPRTRLSLADGERKTLTYSMEGLSPAGTGSLALSVSGASDQPMKKHWTIGLRAAWPAETRQQVDVLAEGESLNFDSQWSSTLVPETVAARLSIASRPVLALRTHLANLLRYPYGCLEQTTSSGWPVVLATPALQQQFGLGVLSNDERVEHVAAALDRLSAKQLSSGGFGLWDRTSPEEHWLTAYATDFLLSARSEGFFVPDGVIDRATDRLESYVRGGAIAVRRYSEDPQHYEAAFKAYAAYALSKINRAPLSALRSLQTQVEEKSASPLPLVHLALALHRMGDPKRAQKLLASAKQRSRPDQYLGEYGSPLRDRALMVHLLLSEGHEETWASELAFSIADMIARRGYLSTQERNALFLAGIALDSNDDDAWQASLAIAEAVETLDRSEPLSRSISAADLNAGLSVTNLSAQRIQAQVHVSGHTGIAPAPVSHGFSIEREVFDVDGGFLSSRTWPVGKLVLVHLKVTSEQRSPEALVVDLLPAGLELENQNLEHAIALDALKIDGKRIPELVSANRLQHEEFRDDRYVAALDLRPGQLAHLFYLARAVTPGRYVTPAPFVEDMYRPDLRAIGKQTEALEVVDR